MLVCQADDNIELHLLEPRHAEELMTLADGYDARPMINEFAFPAHSIEAVREFIGKQQARFTHNEAMWCGIWLEKQLVGVISMRTEVASGTKPFAVSIDYMLAPRFRGMGTMTKACKAFIGYAFDDVGVHRVEIHCDIQNPKSCAIPERLGFVKEGVEREKVTYSSFFGDIAIYGMLCNEW